MINVTPSDGTSLTFTVPQYSLVPTNGNYLAPTTFPGMQYSVVVSNANGTSQQAWFNVTAPVPAPVPVQPTITVSNASVSMGTPLMSASTTVGYNETISFTLTVQGNNSVYMPKSPDNLISKTVTGGTASFPVVTASPNVYAGDTNSAFVIPGGTSRTFTFNGSVRGTPGSMIQLRVTGINYYTDSGLATPANVITTGLDSLTSGSVLGASTMCTVITNNLARESRDDFTNGDVTHLQEFLMTQGYSFTDLGNFGPLTESALSDWQGKQGIDQTGILGPVTRAKIQAVSCQ